MSDKKPSTEDILAQLRGGGAPAPKSSADEPAADSGADAAAEQSAPTQESAPAAPSGTADILASIKGGGAAKPAADKPAAAAPSGTSDILASIKGGGGGAAAKPAAAPSGTADILASIKGGGGGGAAAAKPAAAKPAAKAAPVDTSKASGMSAAEMIEAARKGVVTADPVTGEARPVEKKVALPKKPLAKAGKPKAGKAGATQSRRSAVGTIIGIAWAALVAATAASSLAIARFMMPNVLVEPPTKFKIGPPTDYGGGTVSTKWKAQFGVWIVNDEIDGQQMIYALSTVCTHLGCTPNWLEGEQKFKCPCHGSGFYRKSGINFEGPAPRPLEAPRHSTG